VSIRKGSPFKGFQFKDWNETICWGNWKRQGNVDFQMFYFHDWSGDSIIILAWLKWCGWFQQGDAFGESKIPREDCVIHHTSASLYLFAMFPTRHPRTPPDRAILKTNNHELALRISWPCIISTSIFLGISITWPKEIEKISSFVGKVSSFFLFLILTKIVHDCQIDESFFPF
jgi:hypothetical protein